MNQKMKCPGCGRSFVDNPEKHKSRDKLSPCCLVPYRKASAFNFNPMPRIKEELQHIFSFSPSKHGDSVVCYVCPRCGSAAFSKDEMYLNKQPDKMRFNNETNVTEVVSYMEIPSCKKCGHNLIRRRLASKGGD